MIPCCRAVVRSWAEPGRADVVQSKRPTGSVSTWSFVLWRLCFPEWCGVSAAIRSMGG